MLIWTVVKNSAKSYYENLFRMLLLSLLWFVPSFLLIVVGLGGILSAWLLPAILPTIFLGPLFIALLESANQLKNNSDFSFKIFFIKFKTKFWRGLKAFLFSALIYIILIFDMRFFYLKGRDSLLYMVLAFLFVYLFIYFSIQQLYFWGLLILEPEQGISKTIKYSFVISLDNFLFSLGWFLAIFVITLILTLTGFGLLLIFPPLIGLLIINGTKIISEKY